MNGKMFRSRRTEEGEKNSKYLLTLEKRNYTNILISTLENNGNIVKNQTKISEAHSEFFKNSTQKN